MRESKIKDLLILNKKMKLEKDIREAVKRVMAFRDIVREKIVKEKVGFVEIREEFDYDEF
jgi:hypothetical protein